MTPNPLVSDLIAALDRRNIRYCHFKSNDMLDHALAGSGDLDLLVHFDDVGPFQEILATRCFYVGIDTSNVRTPYVYHYYGLNGRGGEIIHLHVYFQLVTGGSILKNTRIPIENELLTMTRRQSGIPVPIKELDLILFVVRKFIEQVSPVEHFLFIRDYANIKREFVWLRKDSDHDLIRELLHANIPALAPELFFECVNALDKNASLFNRFLLGLRVRKACPYRVRSWIHESVFRFSVFCVQILRSKLRRIRKNRVLYPGGRFIAFVGSEASGKSTLSATFSEWLGEHFDVEHIHLGKPPRCVLTSIPWLLVDCGVFLKGLIRHLGKRIGSATDSNTALPDYAPRPLVALLLALDRERLVRRSIKRMMAGRFIVSDRFPADLVDGPTITNPTGKLGRLMSAWEHRLYASLAPPNLVFKAHAPLETTLTRNSLRETPEPADWIRYRYSATADMTIANTKTFDIDTSRPLEHAMGTIKSRFWCRLSD